MYQKYPQIPEGLSEELQRQVNQWRDEIIKSCRIDREPPVSFDDISYEEYLLPQLTDGLKIEAEQHKEDLKAFSSELIKFCYEKQLYEDMKKVCIIQDLKPEESAIIYSSDEKEIHIFRVWRGFVYLTYTVVDGMKRLTDAKPISCVPEELADFYNKLQEDTMSAYYPYLPVDDCSSISQMAWVHLNEDVIFP